jgi:hypothetical protein
LKMLEFEEQLIEWGDGLAKLSSQM